MIWRNNIPWTLGFASLYTYSYHFSGVIQDGTATISWRERGFHTDEIVSNPAYCAFYDFTLRILVRTPVGSHGDNLFAEFHCITIRKLENSCFFTFNL